MARVSVGLQFEVSVLAVETLELRTAVESNNGNVYAVWVSPVLVVRSRLPPPPHTPNQGTPRPGTYTRDVTGFRFPRACACAVGATALPAVEERRLEQRRRHVRVPHQQRHARQAHAAATGRQR